MAETFHARFCRHAGISSDHFGVEVLKRTLYRRARVLRSVCLLFDRDFFAADNDFIAGVGQLTRRRDFHSEVQDFHTHPSNHGFLRRHLRFRVSVMRMSRLFHEAWPEDEMSDAGNVTSDTPFERETRGRAAPEAGRL